MIAILTGDIINSRAHEVTNWLPSLKEVLAKYGDSPKDWEIFRGDSFQLKVAPQIAFIAAIHLKAQLKQYKGLDVRTAIGLGEETYTGKTVSESNGQAYVNSGKCFENLNKQHLGIHTNDPLFNEKLNLMLDLNALTINFWTPAVAEVIKVSIENPEKNQQELAKQLGKSQSNVSELLSRGGFDEVLRLNKYYTKHLPKK